MIDYTPTEDQENLREMAHHFAEREIRPLAWEYDRDATWPQAIIDKAWGIGLMNSHPPEQYGGVAASPSESKMGIQPHGRLPLGRPH